jgi:hypothetical protein
MHPLRALDDRSGCDDLHDLIGGERRDRSHEAVTCGGMQPLAHTPLAVADRIAVVIG